MCGGYFQEYICAKCGYKIYMPVPTTSCNTKGNINPVDCPNFPKRNNAECKYGDKRTKCPRCQIEELGRSLNASLPPVTGSASKPKQSNSFKGTTSLMPPLPRR